MTNAERKQRHYKRRREMLDEIKVARGCVDCGYNFAAEALDFDHRDPSEKEIGFNPSNHSWERLMLEVAKCDVRCANCHRIRSKRERHGQFRRSN